MPVPPEGTWVRSRGHHPKIKEAIAMADLPLLSSRQRYVLWLMSQGYSTVSAGQQFRPPLKKNVIIDCCLHIRRRLSVRTTAQAVAVGIHTGEIGPYRDCGSRQTYLRHLDNDEDACTACRNANRRWLKEQACPPPPPRPLTDVQIRIIRAFDVGRSHRDLQASWGVSRAKLHRAVADMYIRLGVSSVQRSDRREAALAEARRRGHLRRDSAELSAVRTLAPADRLTPKQQRILFAVQGDVSLTQAAREIGITRTSISTRLCEIYRKLDVTHLPRREKRAAALRIAQERGLLALSDPQG